MTRQISELLKFRQKSKYMQLPRMYLHISTSTYNTNSACDHQIKTPQLQHIFTTAESGSKQCRTMGASERMCNGTEKHTKTGASDSATTLVQRPWRQGSNRQRSHANTSWRKCRLQSYSEPRLFPLWSPGFLHSVRKISSRFTRSQCPSSLVEPRTQFIEEPRHATTDTCGATAHIAQRAPVPSKRGASTFITTPLFNRASLIRIR